VQRDRSRKQENFDYGKKTGALLWVKFLLHLRLHGQCFSPIGPIENYRESASRLFQAEHRGKNYTNESKHEFIRNHSGANYMTLLRPGVILGGVRRRNFLGSNSSGEKTPRRLEIDDHTHQLALFSERRAVHSDLTHSLPPKQ